MTRYRTVFYANSTIYTDMTMHIEDKAQYDEAFSAFRVAISVPDCWGFLTSGLVSAQDLDEFLANPCDRLAKRHGIALAIDYSTGSGPDADASSGTIYQYVDLDPVVIKYMQRRAGFL